MQLTVVAGKLDGPGGQASRQTGGGRAIRWPAVPSLTTWHAALRCQLQPCPAVRWHAIPGLFLSALPCPAQLCSNPPCPSLTALQHPPSSWPSAHAHTPWKSSTGGAAAAAGPAAAAASAPAPASCRCFWCCLDPRPCRPRPPLPRWRRPASACCAAAELAEVAAAAAATSAALSSTSLRLPPS